MTEPKKQPDKVEACIANAIKILEKADDLAKYGGQIDEEIFSGMTDELIDLMKNWGPPLATAVGLMEDHKFRAAHDLITKVALGKLVECACGKVPYEKELYVAFGCKTPTDKEVGALQNKIKELEEQLQQTIRKHKVATIIEAPPRPLPEPYHRPIGKVADNQGNIVNAGEVQEKARYNEDLSKGGRWE